ncbi:MAG: DUF2156 domain-containing protein [Dissulfurimicrobium sp.]|uniref:DUF2156 domain-containing protein n=1 Tax=Dissulfurimicrobium sp. TaxID=2022436 RepID=UPI0040493589
MIPPFPNFKFITLEDKDAIDTYLSLHPPLCSEFTFTNLFAWAPSYGLQISRFGDGFLILCDTGKKQSFLQPLVHVQAMDAIIACLDFLKTRTKRPVIERVGEDFVKYAFSDKTDLNIHLDIHEDRDNFDYIYDIEELIALKGKKFHAKRNHLNNFIRRYKYNYMPITSGILMQCMEFVHEWYNERECEKDDGLTKEKCATYRMLRYFDELGIKGGVIEIGGVICALTMGEKLNDDTLVIHIEKAKAGIQGLYQAINWEFLRHEAGNLKFVNREQDLGILGLRRAKKSYNPVRMIKKYKIFTVPTHSS